eukprot:GHVQ01014640.1.p2 GENE.GHVQ01014640.1~~GHVQ01014640.1.p2  ORF type:complete len:101 (+),score=9.46 GHVQ01014640.1:1234-1536(+)
MLLQWIGEMMLLRCVLLRSRTSHNQQLSSRNCTSITKRYVMDNCLSVCVCTCRVFRDYTTQYFGLRGEHNDSGGIHKPENRSKRGQPNCKNDCCSLWKGP